MPALFFERNKYRDAFTIKSVFPKWRHFGYLELEKKKKKNNDNHTNSYWTRFLFFLFFPIKSNLLLF